jgi:hypothetical protein
MIDIWQIQGSPGGGDAVGRGLVRVMRAVSGARSAVSDAEADAMRAKMAGIGKY